MGIRSFTSESALCGPATKVFKETPMKFILLATLAALSLNAVAAQRPLELPSCDIQGQRAMVGETGGKITDIRQAHISVRANILTADISTKRKARRITQVEADHMFRRVEAVRQQNDSLVKQQGFLSAAEKASFDREFDSIALQLCK
jgi:hypothetical protein